MKKVASLEMAQAATLSERLKAEAIPVEVRTIKDDSGLDLREIFVEDNYFERACDVAEKWEGDLIEEQDRQRNKHCPKCGSLHLEYISFDNPDLGFFWKCVECGNEFPS